MPAHPGAGERARMMNVLAVSDFLRDLFLILLASLCVGRPDLGVEVAAFWSLISTIILALRLAMAEARSDRGEAIRPWQERQEA